MKLEHIFEINGQILTQTGLHIGGGKDSVEIGGMDQPIIKHQSTSNPTFGFIPQRKMRSMLENVFSLTSLKPMAKGRECQLRPIAQ